jgi:glucosamine--fructose-6-phosphate aminotransferase (isomerizing)
VPNPDALVVVISQSGETADTLSALKHAKSLGHHHTLAICNVPTSSMVRQTALTYLTRAGVEIGVASTKAFTTQLTALFLLTLTLAKQRGRLDAAQEAPVQRVTGWDVPYPSGAVEQQYIPSVDRILLAVQRVLDY